MSQKLDSVSLEAAREYNLQNQGEVQGTLNSSNGSTPEAVHVVSVMNTNDLPEVSATTLPDDPEESARKVKLTAAKIFGVIALFGLLATFYTVFFFTAAPATVITAFGFSVLVTAVSLIFAKGLYSRSFAKPPEVLEATSSLSQAPVQQQVKEPVDVKISAPPATTSRRDLLRGRDLFGPFGPFKDPFGDRNTVHTPLGTAHPVLSSNKQTFRTQDAGASKTKKSDQLDQTLEIMGKFDTDKKKAERDLENKLFKLKTDRDRAIKICNELPSLEAEIRESGNISSPEAEITRLFKRWKSLSSDIMQKKNEAEKTFAPIAEKKQCFNLWFREFAGMTPGNLEAERRSYEGKIAENNAELKRLQEEPTQGLGASLVALTGLFGGKRYELNRATADLQGRINKIVRIQAFHFDPAKFNEISSELSQSTLAKEEEKLGIPSLVTELDSTIKQLDLLKVEKTRYTKLQERIRTKGDLESELQGILFNYTCGTVGDLRVRIAEEEGKARLAHKDTMNALESDKKIALAALEK